MFNLTTVYSKYFFANIFCCAIAGVIQFNVSFIEHYNFFKKFFCLIFVQALGKHVYGFCPKRNETTAQLFLHIFTVLWKVRCNKI